MASQSRRLQIINGFSTYFAAAPIMVVFLASIGLSQTQIGVGQAIYTATWLLCSVPAGWLGDHYNRPVCLAIGIGATAVVFGTYGLVTSFTGAIAMEVMLGIGAAMVIGSRSSLVGEWGAIETASVGRQYARAYFHQELYAVPILTLGGVLGAIEPRWALVFTALTFAASGLMMPCLRETDRKKNLAGHTFVLAEMQQDVKEALGEMKAAVIFVFRSRALRWNTLALAVSTQMGRALLWIKSAIFLQVGIPMWAIGLAWAGQLFCSAIGSLLVRRIVHQWSDRRLLILPAVLSLSATLAW